ncbi:penicillin-binding transpeptidase domain-containing protein [Cellulosimicrobium sp. CUA-896]|uniref:penicillin-binding transpeptidase domain-containing protein n=1 Tax=Cellulosimicrobium sp. CUA-896 TaxID=1517881 RepID=UPI00095E3EB7|nr:penicillin-binding transpeptidase domain-containing protein [Cellulosimicrobium sp. CUA-896]OLT51725.1 penicillin-binding protein [Cellulosimicrobium sp. CUA-896]
MATVVRTRPRAARRRLAAALLVPALALPLAACSPDRPAPEDTAADLAAGIARGDVGGLAFSNGTAESVQGHLDAVLEPVSEFAHTVEVDDVVLDEEGDDAGERATATLAYRWDVTQDAAWEYTTTVDLTFAEPGEGEDGPGRWEAAWEPDVLVPDLGQNDRLAVERVRAERAEIVGLDDAPIVTERPVYRLGVDKTRVDAAGWDGAARALAGVVGLDPEEFAQRVAGAGGKAFVEAITVRTEDTAGIDVDAARQIEGVAVLDDELPLAPTREFARQILGRVGDATAEIVDESEGAVVAGDTVGLSGLQRQYDEQLRGTPGVSVSIVPGGETDAEPAEVFAVEPVAGVPLRTTLRPDMQVAAEQVLAGQTSPSAIVAIRPSTGEVLTAASGTAGEGMSTATTGQYAPGSTFKVATTLAMLRAGLTPDSTVACPPELTVDGRAFQNVPGYPTDALGEVPLRTAFANSCNTAMIGQRDAVSQQALHDAAASLGLGVESDLGAPAFFGDVPAEADGTDHAASMIGQGRVLASPLGMATVAASVAAGHRVAPVMVRPDVQPASAEQPAGDLTEDEAATLRSLMRSVVTDGSADVLADLPGEVGAKTGTAQYGDGTQAHAWMIAVQGDLAVAVFVETGDGGSTTAGPLMRAFLDAPNQG